MMHQIRQQLELGVGQADRLAVAADAARKQIDLEPAAAQRSRGDLSGGAQLSSDPSVELRDRERLDHVVNRAGVEPLDAILDLAAGSQHDHRETGALLHELVENRSSVASGEHQVEHDEIDVVLERQFQAGVAVERRAHVQAAGGEPALDEIDDSRFVLDHHDVAHAVHHKSPFIAANPGKESSHLRVNAPLAPSLTLVGMTVGISQFTSSRRDAGLRRLRVANRVLAVAAIVLTLALAEIAAHGFHGHARKLVVRSTPLRSTQSTAAATHHGSKRDDGTSRSPAPRCRRQAPTPGTAAEQRHHGSVTARAANRSGGGSAGARGTESVDDRVRRIVSIVELSQTGATAAPETWEALGTTVVLRLDTWDRSRRAAGRRAVERELEAIDAAASRFRSDSELSRVNRAGGSWVPIGPLLRDAIALALHAAQVTEGAVDPTLGRDLVELGYDRDWRELDSAAGERDHRARAPTGRESLEAWRLVELDDARLPASAARGA